MGRARQGWLAVVALVLVTSASSYTVAPGDTLSGIAGRFGVPIQALVDANGLADPDRIYVGQVLSIPGAPASTPGAADVQHHVVGPGDTLAGIAAAYGVSVGDLVAANGISDPNRILAGSRLRITAQAPAVEAAGPPLVPALAAGGGAAATYVVRPGDTLGGIAAGHDVSISDLVEANGIADPDLIRVGQRLEVPGAGPAWHCPVPDVARFVDDFGAPRAGGRFHEGTDLFAPRGAPVVAPVAGVVTQVNGDRGGLQFRLDGDDGFVYFGTHMDSAGASGRVAAGDLLGTVGTTGNAAGTDPHLHFEAHPVGQPPINPYPSLELAC